MSKEYTIHRVKKSDNFTIIHNEIYRNKEMSLQAMALHTYIMTLPDDWKIYKKELPNNFKNGETSVNTAWKELEDNGYIVGIRKREKGTGKFIGIEYHCYEKSQNKDKSPQSDFPVVGKPNVGNQVLLNTNSTKNLINKENTTYSGESKDSLQ
jgi:hypothetical protein